MAAWQGTSSYCSSFCRGAEKTLLLSRKRFSAREKKKQKEDNCASRSSPRCRHARQDMRNDSMAPRVVQHVCTRLESEISAPGDGTYLAFFWHSVSCVPGSRVCPGHDKTGSRVRSQLGSSKRPVSSLRGLGSERADVSTSIFIP